MKKISCFITLFLISSLCSQLSAQFKAGIIGGFNFADLDLKDETSSRTVWGLGAVVDLHLYENFSIRAEPMYIKKGGVIEADSDSPRITARGEMLELLLFAKYEIGNVEKLYFLAGPSIAFLLSNKIDAEVNGIHFNSDITENTEKIDFGINFGAGLQFPIGILTVFLEGRYSLGLNNLQKGGTYEYSAGRLVVQEEMDVERDKFKSRGFQLMLGATIPL
jgi:hypothetical protein